MKVWLERALNLGTCALLVVIVTLFLKGGGPDGAAIDSVDKAPSRAGPQYDVGDSIGLDIPFDRAKLTLLAFVTSTCQYCITSMPFYRAIADDAARTQGAFQFVVASPEPLENLRRFVQEHRLTVDHLQTIVPRNVRIVATPTLVLADRAGVVKKVWVGEQPEARRTLILSLLRQGQSQ